MQICDFFQTFKKNWLHEALNISFSKEENNQQARRRRGRFESPPPTLPSRGKNIVFKNLSGNILLFLLDPRPLTEIIAMI